MQDLPSPRPGKAKRHSSHFVQDARDKINRTISFMEKEYKRAISREQLAAIAELNSEHYSRIFRKYTGSSPMNYLVELRINKAKELLLHSTYSIAEIGHMVGYSDPYHFSRRFKQIVGVAPTHYAKSALPRIIALDGLGHCQALRIAPVAADIARVGGYISLDDSAHIQHISDALHPRLNYAVLQALRPAWIITANEAVQPDIEKLANIIHIDVLQDPIYAQLRQVAAALNRTKEAEAWTAQYEAQCKALRADVFASIGTERVAILRVREQLLQVYGVLNMGYPLYNSLQLAPPEKIAMQCMCNKYFHSSVITIDELPFYEAEHLFVVLQPDKGAYRQWQTMLQSSAWQRFLAVQKGNVHHLDVANWLANDPISIQRQMQEAAQLLIKAN
ncbi:hypothetical protein J40TS1_28760 [Paenibacillus montaniterrae]|uniref:AraC family transcriptional regulator n=1 Tax=Paenibacillus montaniterrae TaxID=429341 RepID=A0A919YRY5_9BACL|nr:helix-turn-helix domain-containing protein [Paenibacillus montaniterrae]GIP17234.1 hypothetical protein J40TS1_28760 [Paenibacillus montaniterrae]